MKMPFVGCSETRSLRLISPLPTPLTRYNPSIFHWFRYKPLGCRPCIRGKLIREYQCSFNRHTPDGIDRMYQDTPYQKMHNDGTNDISPLRPHNYSTSDLLFLRLTAILEKFIKKDAGKQKPTRTPSTARMKKKISSIAVPTNRSTSIPIVPNNDAMIPIAGSTANEMTPALVIFCSMFCSLIIVFLHSIFH